VQSSGVAKTQNLTLRLPTTTVQKAKVVAARRGTSISALVEEKIAEIAGENEAYTSARRQALNALERGLHLGGQPLSRDDAHRRR